MKPMWFFRVLMLVVLLAMLVGTRGTAQAGIRTPENGDLLPFYARWFEPVDGGRVAWVFYHDPACVPEGFNLLDFYDPAAPSCLPSSTKGFMLWENDPETDPGPVLSLLHGKGAVPVWFISTADFGSAAADGILTMEELRALPSLEQGEAAFYQETFRPYMVAVTSTLLVEGHGSLSDGRAFKIHLNANLANYKMKVTVTG